MKHTPQAHARDRLSRRRVLAGLGGLAAGSMGLPMARAEANWPNKPLRFVVPYAAGGGTDLLIRVVQDALGRALGQPIIIDNKSGGGGLIAAREVARSAPDGYTFFVSNDGPSVLLPLVQKDAGYDPVASFAPITTLATAPIVLIAHGSVPAGDPAEFIAWARKQPKSVSYATAGVGSFGHLCGESFSRMTGIPLLHVPYRGQAPTLNAVIAGETQAAFTSSTDLVLQQVQAKAIRMVGVGSAQPSHLVPGARTIASAVPGYTAEFWQGLLAPAKTPPAIVKRLHAELATILADAEIRKRYAAISYEASTMTPEAFARHIAAEVETFRALIQERGIKLES